MFFSILLRSQCFGVFVYNFHQAGTIHACVAYDSSFIAESFRESPSCEHLCLCGGYIAEQRGCDTLFWSLG